ncbi:MAG: methyltransferase domain-containing protein [Polyangiaceae bacterium]|nr:methyltransferase domain-containing protein [Polyangiaceae bacterium]
MRRLVGLALVATLAACQKPARLQERSLAPPTSSTSPRRDPPGFYMGREIAPTMTHDAADWLIRETRDSEENATRMLAELGLKPGDVACDLGAGNGYHTLKMARAVAPAGKAYAVDIQPEMLDLLRERAKADGVTNVELVLGSQTGTNLPKGVCDLILMADVYHELSDPEAVLRDVRRALSARGRLVLLEFRGEDPDVPIKPEHKMTRAQIMKEMSANGLSLVRSFDELPWQHLMFFAASP